MTWSETIPGTKFSRLEFLTELHLAHTDPTSTSYFYRGAKILQLSEYGLLNQNQIGEVVGCSAATVRATLRAAGRTAEHIRLRGKLSGGALELMLEVAKRYARGKEPAPEHLEQLIQDVSAVTLERLVGVPRSRYYRTVERQKRLVRK